MNRLAAVALLLFLSSSIGLALGQLPQIMKAEPSAKVLLVSEGALSRFETGVWLKSGESLRYSFTIEPADTAVRFDIHSHDLLMRTIVFTTQTVRGSYAGEFRAPSDGPFYPYWENLGKSEVSVAYRVMPPARMFTLALNDKSVPVKVLSNSQILEVRGDGGAVSVRAQTPLFMGGYVNITLPSYVQVVDVSVDKEQYRSQITSGGDEATYTLMLREGTHEVVLSGKGLPGQSTPSPASNIPLGPVIAVVAVSVAAVVALRTRKRRRRRR